MTNIIPISDLKNYSEVPEHCDDGSPSTSPRTDAENT